jgi:hypothetical protein
MRALFVFVVVCFIPIKTAFSQVVDYSSFAPSERAQLSKCFSDMLTVVTRHNLREQLLPLLEAGCAGEIRSYRDALRPHWSKTAQQSDIENYFARKIEDQKEFVYFVKSLINKLVCGSTCMETPTMGTIMLIASMEEHAFNLFKAEPVSICSGDTCALDEYRKCLLLQASVQISKRTKPGAFENAAQQVCKQKESSARNILITEFLNVQKRQQNSRLSERTRSLIDEIINFNRHEAVISYAEDLSKVQPGRRSCKPEMCGDRECISLDPEPEPEYKCAIAD